MNDFDTELNIDELSSEQQDQINFLFDEESGYQLSDTFDGINLGETYQ